MVAFHYAILHAVTVCLFWAGNTAFGILSLSDVRLFVAVRDISRVVLGAAAGDGHRSQCPFLSCRVTFFDRTITIDVLITLPGGRYSTRRLSQTNKLP
jgi:hypothetical protein